MTAFASSLQKVCVDQAVDFEESSRIRCLAHVMNIAVQHGLKAIKSTAYEDENTILALQVDNGLIGNIVLKVTIFKFIYYIFNIIKLYFKFFSCVNL
jgi:hypothetical protein